MVLMEFSFSQKKKQIEILIPMIPRPSIKTVLAEIQACAPEMTPEEIRKFLAFLETCEYIGDGKYVVTVLKQGFGEHDYNKYPSIIV